MELWEEGKPLRHEPPIKHVRFPEKMGLKLKRAAWEVVASSRRGILDPR